LRELADQARARSGVRYARFFDRHGLLLVSAGNPPTGAPPAAAAAAPAGPIAVGADFWEFQAPILVAEPRARQLHAPAALVAGGRAGTVAVAISPDPRTPLNVIISYAEMLADGTGAHLDEEQANMIAAIERYSRQQLDLIANVLDFARLSSGHISFQVERFALAPLLTEIQTLHT